MASHLNMVTQEFSAQADAAEDYPDGRFYAIEGLDGSGKTTVSRKLFQKLSEESRREVVLTAEPTDCWLGDQVRRGADEDISPYTEALLFVADRATHTEKIRKWLSQGIIVLCDRYNPSTLAYQGALLRREMGDEALEWLKVVSEHVIIRPDIIFLLDLSPEKAMERLSSRDTRSKFETLSYLKEVHDIYHRIAEEDSNYFLVDAARPVDEVVEEILRAIKNNL